MLMMLLIMIVITMIYCMKSDQIRSCFWSEYRKMRTRSNSVFRYFSRMKIVFSNKRRVLAFGIKFCILANTKISIPNTIIAFVQNLFGHKKRNFWSYFLRETVFRWLLILFIQIRCWLYQLGLVKILKAL